MIANKRAKRMRRAIKARARIRLAGRMRLSVHRSARHVYAQIFDPEVSRVLASCSSLDERVRSKIRNTGGKEAAALVGRFIADSALEAGITEVAFDRSGFKYHGRVGSLADAARKHGLKF